MAENLLLILQIINFFFKSSCKSYKKVFSTKFQGVGHDVCCTRREIDGGDSNSQISAGTTMTKLDSDDRKKRWKGNG